MYPRALAVQLVLAVGSLSFSHIVVYWFSNWLPISPLKVVVIFLLAFILYVLLAVAFIFDPRRSGITTACIVLLLIELYAILMAGGPNLSEMSFTASFNIEIATLFLLPASYFAGGLISLRQTLKLAQYEAELAQHESSSSQVQDSHQEEK